MDFGSLLLPVPRRAVFAMDDWYVWCGSAVRDQDGLYHLLFSRWPKAEGFSAWVTRSEIAHAVSADRLGPYEFQGVVLAGAGGKAWDRDVTHNPTILAAGGRYFLYYMGNYGNGEYWNHRNNQRIGVAVADHPGGPWQRFDRPVLDVAPGCWDCLMTSNPTVCEGPDGRFVMVYKGVGDGPMPKGGAVLSGVAFADDPLGPFTRFPEPILRNPENPWAVEDGFVWYQDGRYYLLIKDFQGYFTRAEKGCIALFESRDAEHWELSGPQPAVSREIHWEDGQVEHVRNLERPQLLLEAGVPTALLCACAPEGEGPPERSFNLAMPLRH